MMKMLSWKHCFSHFQQKENIMSNRITNLKFQGFFGSISVLSSAYFAIYLKNEALLQKAAVYAKMKYFTFRIG